MTRRPKGFDPLASLFQDPNEESGPVEETTAGRVEGAPRTPVPTGLEPTDSFFGAPPDGPMPAAAPAKPAAPPPQPADPVALARALGRAAAAAAGPPKARPAAPSTTAAAPAVAPRFAPPQPRSPGAASLGGNALPPPQGTAPKRNASDIVADALRREASMPPQARGLPVRPAVPTPRPGSMPASTPNVSRPQSPVAAPPAHVPTTLVERVQDLVGQRLRAMRTLKVANCISIGDREVLRALWKAHRSRLAAEGKLDQVVAATAVLEALRRVPPGQLVAAHVLVDPGDYLLWIDLRDGTPLAAFADARAWYVGGDQG
jgi:hypothetical protein